MRCDKNYVPRVPPVASEMRLPSSRIISITSSVLTQHANHSTVHMHIEQNVVSRQILVFANYEQGRLFSSRSCLDRCK